MLLFALLYVVYHVHWHVLRTEHARVLRVLQLQIAWLWAMNTSFARLAITSFIFMFVCVPLPV